jgi:phage-related minor tail protein
MNENDTSIDVKVDADTQDAMRKLGDLEIQANAFGKALTGAFKSSIIGGKDLSSVMSKLALSLSNMALSKALAPLERSFSGAIDGLMGGLFKRGTSGAGSPLNITPFANGGVVSNPTYFPMGGASSVGLMGEAGSEAILPLSRGPDGSLGVASTMGGSSPVNITFNIATPDVEGFARSEAQVSAMLARAVGRGRRGL